jgi:hypothetical protein
MADNETLDCWLVELERELAPLFENLKHQVQVSRSNLVQFAVLAKMCEDFAVQSKDEQLALRLRGVAELVNEKRQEFHRDLTAPLNASELGEARKLF